MAKSILGDLLARRAALEKQIAEAQREHRSDAIAKVKAMMAEYGVTLSDITSGKSAAAPAMPAAKKAKVQGKSGNAGKKVAPKFRNNATGETWSGRGLKPKWMTAALAQGRSISDFAL